MEQLSRTSLFSELSDLSVTGADDGDQCKDLEANSPPKMVSESPTSPVSGRYFGGHATPAWQLSPLLRSRYLGLSPNLWFSSYISFETKPRISHFRTAFSSQIGAGLRPVASLHGSPKPLQASSSLGLGQSSNKRQRPYSSISDDESEDSDLEYDEDEIVVGRVMRDSDFYAQLEKEEKANAQVGRWKTIKVSNLLTDTHTFLSLLVLRIWWKHQDDIT